MAKYDDASWHFGGEYPKDLGRDNASTHIGMFLAWAIDNQMISDLLQEQFPKELQKFKDKIITGAQIVRLCCDEKLTSDDLNSKGNAFARYYYASNIYFDDYAEVFRHDGSTIYHVIDNQANYRKIRLKIDGRFIDWSKKHIITGPNSAT